jgi:U4/U6.U5 tri-snRNP-associated protein 2
MSEANQRKRPKSNSIDVEPTSKKPRLENESKEPEIVVAEPATEPELEVSNDLYLDTVNRQFLDFDFEKLCSVSLSNLNVYACLVCGKYYQGQICDAE